MGPFIAVLSLFLQNGGRVVRLDAELSSISAKLDKKIAVQPSLGKKLIFISNPDIPPSRLLALLAVAAHGTTSSVPGGLRLERTTSDANSIRVEARTERANWIRDRLKAVSEYRSQTLLKGTLTTAISREVVKEAKIIEEFLRSKGPRPSGFFATQLLPSAKLLESLISRIGIDELASIPSNTIKIFEDFPVDDALPLPAHEDLLDRYVTDSVPLESFSFSPETTDAISRLGRKSSFSQIGQETKRPVKLRLKVTDRTSDIVLNLEGFDGAGNRVLTANFFTTGRTSGRLYTDLANDEVVNPLGTWSPLGAATQAVINGLLDPRGSRSGTVPEWLLHAENREPLDLFVTSVLGSFVARNTADCTVIDLDDFFWQFVRLCCRNGELCVSALEAELDQVEDYERIQCGTSLVIRPRITERSEESQADRKALGRAARGLVSGREDRLRLLSKLFYEASRKASSLAIVWARTALQFVPEGSGDILDDYILRLLGAISDSDWKSLQEGHILSAAQLDVTEQTRELLLTDTHPIVGTAQPSDLKRHPTELYELDSIGATRISFAGSESSVVRWSTPGNNWSSWQPLGALMAFAPAAIIWFPSGKIREIEDLDSFGAKLGRGRRFQIAKESDRVITLTLPEGFRIDIPYRGALHDIGPQCLYAELPADLRENLWRETKEVQIHRALDGFANLRSDPSTGAQKVIKP